MVLNYNFIMAEACVYSVSPLKSNCLLEQSFVHDNVDLRVKYNNSVGLSESYNSIIDSEVTHKYVILCHHDVSLQYTNLLYNVQQGLNRYDVIGVAGGINPQITEKNLWHWMMPASDYRGFAAHASTPGKMFVTHFGLTPDRVAVLDGVFLAFDHEKIKKSGARFDAQFTWHHYDVDFCLTCNQNKLKLGVYPILVYHESPGLRDINQTEWNQSNQAFISKWKLK